MSLPTPRKSKIRKFKVPDDFRSNAAVPPDVSSQTESSTPWAKLPVNSEVSDIYGNPGNVSLGSRSQSKRAPIIETFAEKPHNDWSEGSRRIDPTRLHTRTQEPFGKAWDPKSSVSQCNTPISSSNLGTASAQFSRDFDSLGTSNSRPRRPRAKSAEKHFQTSSVSPARTGSRTPEFYPPSHYAAAARISNSSMSYMAATGKITANNDNNKKDFSLVSEVNSTSSRSATPSAPSFSLGNSPVPSSAAQPVKRRRTFSRSPKATKEKDKTSDAVSETRNLVRRASQLGLPELEKDLLPSLKDTISRMTQPMKQHSLIDSENRINALSSANSNLSSVTFRNHHMGPLLSPAAISPPIPGEISSGFFHLKDRLFNDNPSRAKFPSDFYQDGDNFGIGKTQDYSDSNDVKQRSRRSPGYFNDQLSTSGQSIFLFILNVITYSISLG